MRRMRTSGPRGGSLVGETAMATAVGTGGASAAMGRVGSARLESTTAAVAPPMIEASTATA